MKLLKNFANAFSKIKGIITGGSDSTTENVSAIDKMRGTVKKSKSEINRLHNYNTMMKKRVAVRRMRNKMRRATQQQQRT